MIEKIKCQLFKVSIVVAVILCFSFTASSALAAGMFAGGSGTEEDPYLITTKEHLDYVRYYLDAHFKMAEDIIFVEEDFAESGDFYNGGAGWEPIGDATTKFTGTFDGDGHTITGLFINHSASSDAYVGLFGYAEGATINNLGMLDSEIVVTAVSYDAYAGSIVGRGIYNTISDCYNSGTVSVTTTKSGYSYAGGIVGGSAISTISNCYNTGCVSAASQKDSFAGGISGRNGTISGCYNIGDVTAIDNSAINDGCFSYAAGIVAENASSIIRCYNGGEINSDACAAGIFPKITSGNISISNCYNIGSVNGDTCGGIVASFPSSYGNTRLLTCCYNAGTVRGGIAHSASTTNGLPNGISNCYYLSGRSNYGIASKADDTKATIKCTHAEMKNQSTFAGFDFDTVWTMGGNEEYLYPELRDVSMDFTKKAEQLVVSKMPAKTQYIEATPFDSTGLTIIAEYNNGEVEIVDDYELSGYTAKVGTNRITVSHMGATVTFTVEVVAKKLTDIEVTKLPDKLVYLEGDAFNEAGMVVTGYYDNSTSETVTDYTVSGYTSTPGEKTITVTCGGKTAMFVVNVVPKSLTGIAVTTKPNKLTYSVGETFDSSGLEVTAYYDNKTTAIVPPDSITGFDPTLGVKDIIVSYGAFSDTFEVEVAAYAAISMQAPPTKCEYLEGKEPLEVSGGKIRVIYTNGDYKIVDITEEMVTGFDNRVIGEQTLTVIYGGFTTTYIVEIIEKTIVSITVSPPGKLVYEVGEELNVAGGKVTLFYNNETSETIDLTADMVAGFDSRTAGTTLVTVTYENCISSFRAEIINKTLISNTWNTVSVTPQSLPIGAHVLIALYSDCGQQLDSAMFTWKEEDTLVFESQMIGNSSVIRVFYLDENWCPLRDNRFAVTMVCTQHAPIKIPAVEATCTKTGLTEGSQCSVCKKILLEQQLVPVSPHTPTELPAVEATCTKTGLTEGSRCSECGEVLAEQKIVPKADHAWIDATCTEKKTCSACGTVVGEALGHQYKDGVCIRCGENEPNEKPAFTFLKNHIIAHGITPGNGYYDYQVHTSSSGSHTHDFSLSYDSELDQITISQMTYVNHSIDTIALCSIYLEPDLSGVYFADEGYLTDSDISAGSLTVNASTFSLSSALSFDVYTGKYTASSMMDLFVATLDAMLNKMNTMVLKNSPYSMGDFGFNNYYA